MSKTPDVVDLDKSHVSFCGKAFRFQQEIERSLHETKSEISWNREAWVHETKSEFVEGRGERCTKSSRNSTKAGEGRCTKSCRNSSVCGRRPPRHCQRVRHRTAGERGERLSSQRRKRRCRKRKKYPTQGGYFYMKTDFDVVCFQKVSRPKPF